MCRLVTNNLFLQMYVQNAPDRSRKVVRITDMYVHRGRGNVDGKNS